MGPKVESALRFLKGGGKEVVITSYEHLMDAVEGRMGTRVTPDPAPVAAKTTDTEVSVGG
jgi:hypothetical protein